MSNLIDTVQLDDVGEAIVDLFDITLPTGTTLHLFNGLNDDLSNVYFPSKTTSTVNEYFAIPIEIEGFEVSAAGASNRPTLSVANIPRLENGLQTPAVDTNDGFAEETTILENLRNETEKILGKNGLYTNEDLLGSTVVHRRTLASKLKTRGDAYSSPVEFPSQKYILDRVSSESNLVVEFELASPIDVEGVTLPYRQVISKYCSWEYQGHYTKGKGGCTWSLDSKGRFYDKDNKLITADVSADVPAQASIFDPISATYLVGDIVRTGSSPIRYWICVKDTGGPGLVPSANPTYWAEIFYTPLWSSALTYSVGDLVRTETSVPNRGTHIRIWKAIRNVPVDKDPVTHSYYWVRLDVCGKTLQSCKARFQNTSGDGETFDQSKVLPFGGFPATVRLNG